MSKIKILENKLALDCVCECIGNDTDKLYEITDKAEDGNYEIEFKVNGVELDFIKFLEMYDRSYDNCVKGSAREMIEDKMSEITRKMESLLDTIGIIAEIYED